ncbi:MAG: phosphatidate cytidylyltransferase [Planctomycetota bacterium]|nr:phosphatidate cytidylyltransferase [Planctomycetota bacterium]
MLAQRLVVGPILVLTFVGLLLLDLKLGTGAPILAALASVLVARAAWEYCQLVNVRTIRTDWRFLAIFGVATLLANWIPHWTSAGTHAPQFGWPLLVFSLSLVGLFCKAMYQFETPGATIETLGAEVLGLAYVAIFTSATAQLRWVWDGELLYLPLASVVVISKCGDIAAYFTGRAIGGAKLCPRLSPGKTIAGGIGAVVGGTLGGWAWLHWGTLKLTDFQPGPLSALMLYGVVMSLSGMAGDLAESLIKRDVSKKDAPALFPGFGGLLDVLDSVIFCGPIALLLWTLLPLVRRVE